MKRRCYMDGDDDGLCPGRAVYEARLSWTSGVMLLCEDHAAVERASLDVISIRTLHGTRAAAGRHAAGRVPS